MGETCTTHETEEKCIKYYSVKLKEKGVHNDLTENVRFSEVQLTEGSEEMGSCEHGDEI